MTNFFSTLQQTGIGQCALSISFDGETISLSLLPKTNATDKAFDTLKPITLKGTIEELDKHFFEIVQRPMEQAQGIIANTESFERNLKETQSKTAHAKQKKESVKKKSDELKALLKATDFNPMTDHEKATSLAETILTTQPDNKEALKVLADMKPYQQPALF